ncbi:hypothetical protein PPACK8108_LOCUS16564 [Phakopsora pachyrhizi]|uniref:Uncharacterized protein n=1 Tax=Phakopsora pachyrhizi TaxID=170000 RepID=A0AAV0B9H5_PHAPC|nr:hypothetical protein PPACK8108_LOCUS16564 [Phakopsora pachyrhizi]
MKNFVTLPSSSLIALLLIIAINPIVISSERASQPLPSPTFNILKRDFQSSLSVQLANHSSAFMDSRTSLKPTTTEPNLIKLKPINDSNNVQNQRLRVNTRRPLKDNRRSGKLLMEEVDQEHSLSTGGTSEDPDQTVGLDNGCKQSPEMDRYGCDSIQQTVLSQEDQKGEDLVK